MSRGNTIRSIHSVRGWPRSARPPAVPDLCCNQMVSADCAGRCLWTGSLRGHEGLLRVARRHYDLSRRAHGIFNQERHLASRDTI